MLALHAPHFAHSSLCPGSGQEMASRGLSVVYSLGDDAARAQLLQSLTGTLQGARDPAPLAQPSFHTQSPRRPGHSRPCTLALAEGAVNLCMHA